MKQEKLLSYLSGKQKAKPKQPTDEVYVESSAAFAEYRRKDGRDKISTFEREFKTQLKGFKKAIDELREYNEYGANNITEKLYKVDVEDFKDAVHTAEEAIKSRDIHKIKAAESRMDKAYNNVVGHKVAVLSSIYRDIKAGKKSQAKPNIPKIKKISTYEENRRQTGSTHKAIDETEKAKPAGWRFIPDYINKKGVLVPAHYYYEARKNRSDSPKEVEEYNEYIRSMGGDPNAEEWVDYDPVDRWDDGSNVGYDSDSDCYYWQDGEEDALYNDYADELERRGKTPISDIIDNSPTAIWKTKNTLFRGFKHPKFRYWKIYGHNLGAYVNGKDQWVENLVPEKYRKACDTKDDVLKLIHEAADTYGWELVPYETSLDDNTTDEVKPKEEIKSTRSTPPYFSIDEGLARRAKEMYSFSDYKEGSATAGYRGSVNKAWERVAAHKKRVDPMYHEKIDSMFETYSRHLAEYINKENSITASYPSIMIAGGSGFNNRKKAKQNTRAEANYHWYQENVEGFLDKILSVGLGGISSDDKDTVAKLKKKMEKEVELHRIMKQANAYYRKHKTIDGCPDLSAKNIETIKEDEKRFKENKYNEGISYQPFATYQLAYALAEIKRLKSRIEELEKKEDTDYRGWEFDGGKVVFDKEENRIRILYDDKPDEETRNKLKHNGFKWSPKNKAWQRQITRAAIRATEIVTGGQ